MKTKKTKEIWATVLDTKFQRCEVSNLGRCKRFDKRTGQVEMSLGKPLLQYSPKYLWFARDWVHRHVAKAFVKNPNPKKRLQVMHLDDNPHNNAAANLRWSTRRENNSQPRARALRSKNGRWHSHTEQVLRAERGDQTLFFKNGITAAAHFQCSKAFVYRCANPDDWAQRCRGWTLSWVPFDEAVGKEIA